MLTVLLTIVKGIKVMGLSPIFQATEIHMYKITIDENLSALHKISYSKCIKHFM